MLRIMQEGLGISIRAPARGATKSGKHTVVYSVISIRAPARGATPRGIRLESLQYYFNPRSRKGSDSSIPVEAPPPPAFQSALPQGERLTTSTNLSFTADFNPRSRKGSDICLGMVLLFGEISIRAPARGATV